MNKKGLIGLVVVIIVLLVVGFFWFVRNYDFTNEKNLVNNISQTANPASVYCVNQGNKLEIRDEDGGQIGYCVSADGQECEEWDFFRADCFFEGIQKCVPASCCHASSCVLESSAPNCSMTMCTQECRGGTMDCGVGNCAFVDGNCEVKWNEKTLG